MAARTRDLLSAAFFWRPAGAFVAPNLVVLSACAALGLLHPGFWAFGLLFEGVYLLALLGNPRFRRAVARQIGAQSADPIERRKAGLSEDDLERYGQLEARCLGFLPTNHDNPALADALGHLLRAYLELMFTQQRIQRVADDSASTRELQSRLRSLRDRLANRELTAELRASLQAQLALVEQRVANWQSARDKLDLITAELRRIEDHVELLREQELLVVDPKPATQHIDAVTAALRSTDAWIAEQQALFEIPAEAPRPVPLRRDGG